MKNFFNEELQAPNVMTVSVDLEVAKEALVFCSEASAETVSVVSPQWKSDIRWISPNSLHSFKTFYSIFKRLRIARHVREFVELSQDVRMYSGFLVTRSNCAQADFHVDWRDTGNEAFTLITPISENYKGFGLLYKRADGSTAEYEYKPGEAIIFGDSFLHSTKPGRADDPVVLLSFTFGSDNMQHWPKISKTAASQGNMVRMPDGRFQIHDIDAMD